MDPLNNNFQSQNPVPTPTVNTPLTTPQPASHVAPSPISSSPEVQKSFKKIGPIISIFVVIVIIIAVILYFVGSNSNKQPIVSTDTSSVATQQSAVDQSNQPQTVQTVTNTNDDVQSLQNDLSSSTAGVDSQNF